jgi:hypothetical protein
VQVPVVDLVVCDDRACFDSMNLMFTMDCQLSYLPALILSRYAGYPDINTDMDMPTLLSATHFEPEQIATN